MQVVFPKPCKCKVDRKGIDFMRLNGWHRKLKEEYIEAEQAVSEYALTREAIRGKAYEADEKSAKQQVVEELADLITVCVSFLEWLGFDEEDRSELFEKTNEKNRRRGYLDE